MAKIKITKKDLKEDGLRTWGYETYEWIKNNKTFLTIVLTVFFVSLIGIKIFQFRNESITKQANFLYKMALESYYRASMLTEPEKKSERDSLFEETIKNANAMINTFPKHPLTHATLMMKGNILYYKNSFDEAATVFKKAIETARDNREKAEALVGLGYAYENKHFFTNDLPALNLAEQSYTKAIELGMGTEIEYEAMLCKGRILEQKMQNAEAIKLYETIIAKSKEITSKDSKYFKPGTWQYNLLQRYNDFNTVFSFAKDAEFALYRLKGSEGGS